MFYYIFTSTIYSNGILEIPVYRCLDGFLLNWKWYILVYIIRPAVIPNVINLVHRQIKSKPRRAGARYEVEQSVSTNMASVTVWFLEKPGTELNACWKLPPSGPGVSPKAPKLECAESTQFSRRFDTKYAIVSSMFA